MGKSYKRFGIIKDRGLSRSKYNRMHRRVNRQRIRSGLEPLMLNEIVNQYDVHDFISIWNSQFWNTVYNTPNHPLRKFYPTHLDAWRQYFSK